MAMDLGLKGWEKVAKGTFLYMLITEKATDPNAFLTVFASVMNLAKVTYGCTDSQYYYATKTFLKQMESASGGKMTFDDSAVNQLVVKLQAAPLQYNIANKVLDIIVDHFEDDSFFMM